MMAPVLAAKQGFDDEQGRISREAFLHGTEEAQAAGGEHDEENGKLLPHVFEGTALLFSYPAEQGGNLVGKQHDEVFQSQHFPGQSSEKQGTDHGGKSLRFADHENAHTDIDAAENEQKMPAEGFPEKLADGASDQGTEKNAQRIDDGTSHVFSFFWKTDDA